MGILGIVLLVIFIIVCLLLIFMVVIQDEGNDSLGGIFAGGSQSAFGSRSSNVVQKFTYVLGGLFFACAFGLALVNKGSVGNVEAAAQQKSSAAPSEWWNKAPEPSAAPTELAPSSTGIQAPAEPAPAPSGK